MAKNLLVLLITVVLLTIVGEVLLQLLFPIEDPFAAAKSGTGESYRYIESQFLADQQYVLYPEPGLPGMATKIRFSTNNMGFRGRDIGMPKPDGEFRIFMVGGSTTECLYLDNTDAISYVLESFLSQMVDSAADIRVYNAGKSGDRSYDHVAMISQRLVHLDPDLIVVFCGLNDLTAAIYDADYLHRPTSGMHALSFGRLAIYLLTEFQIPRRLYYLNRNFVDPRDETAVLTEIPIKSDYKRKVEYRKSQSISDSPPRTDIAPYRENLTTIAGIVRAHGIRLIFMTQATTWNSKIDPVISEWHWATLRNGVVYSEQAMDSAMHVYNDAMREVGQRRNIPVFETDLLLPKSREYFYDDCHFNIRGASEAAGLLARFLLENGVIGIWRIHSVKSSFDEG